MRHLLQSKYPEHAEKVNFFIGDVRDFDSINNAMAGVDYVFSAAALKQVPACEFYPLQAIRTNILGSENVLEAAIRNGVKRVRVRPLRLPFFIVSKKPHSGQRLRRFCAIKAEISRKRFLLISAFTPYLQNIQILIYILKRLFWHHYPKDNSQSNQYKEREYAFN